MSAYSLAFGLGHLRSRNGAAVTHFLMIPTAKQRRLSYQAHYNVEGSQLSP